MLKCQTSLGNLKAMSLNLLGNTIYFETNPSLLTSCKANINPPFIVQFVIKHLSHMILSWCWVYPFLKTSKSLRSTITFLMINQNLLWDQDTFLKRGIQFINSDSKLQNRWASIPGHLYLEKSMMRILKNSTAETNKWAMCVKQKESSLLLKSLLLCLNKQTKKSFKSWLMKDSQQTSSYTLMMTTIMDWAEIGFEFQFNWLRLRKPSIHTTNEKLKLPMIEFSGWIWTGPWKKHSSTSSVIYEITSILTETKNTGL